MTLEKFIQELEMQRTEWRSTTAHLVVFALCSFCFSILAWAVVAGKALPADWLVMTALRSPEGLSEPRGPPWVKDWLLNFSALGSASVLIFLVLAAAGFLVARREGRSAGRLLAVAGGGQIMSSLLKAGFARARPPEILHEAHVRGWSFPSGHSMMAAIVYLALAAMLSRSQERWTLKAYLLAAAGFAILSVGFSRVYLGVHWPTDVLGGWVAGLAWLSLFRCLPFPERETLLEDKCSNN